MYKLISLYYNADPREVLGSLCEQSTWTSPNGYSEEMKLVKQWRAFLWQLIPLILLTIVWWFIGKGTFAKAGLVGGFIALIPFQWQVFRAFQNQESQDVERFRMSLARAQKGKYILTTILFAVAFVVDRSLNPWVLFVTFGFILLTQLVATVVVLTRQSENLEKVNTNGRRKPNTD